MFTASKSRTCFPAEPYTSIILVSYISICSGTISLPVSGHEDSPNLMTNKCWAANSETLEIKSGFNSLRALLNEIICSLFFIFKVEGEYFIAWLCGWKSLSGQNTSADLNIQMKEHNKWKPCYLVSFSSAITFSVSMSVLNSAL